MISPTGAATIVFEVANTAGASHTLSAVAAGSPVRGELLLPVATLRTAWVTAIQETAPEQQFIDARARFYDSSNQEVGNSAHTLVKLTAGPSSPFTQPYNITTAESELDVRRGNIAFINLKINTVFTPTATSIPAGTEFILHITQDTAPYDKTLAFPVTVRTFPGVPALSIAEGNGAVTILRLMYWDNAWHYLGKLNDTAGSGGGGGLAAPTSRAMTGTDRFVYVQQGVAGTLHFAASTMTNMIDKFPCGYGSS